MVLVVNLILLHHGMKTDNKEYYLWCIENDMIPYY